MKICYFDAVGGISGDMLVAALLDAADLEDYLLSELNKLPLNTWQWQSGAAVKNGFYAKKVDFVISEHQQVRHLPEITEIIKGAGFGDAVTQKILTVFDLLAEAESKAHGIAKEDVHFHEVGADDTILDITSVVLLLEKLAVSKLYATPLPLGSGTTKSAHGVMPLPGPALNHLLKDVMVYGIDEGRETVTPTGIALLKAYHAEFSPMPPMKITAIGTGCGTSELQRPNILRCFLGEGAKGESFLYQLECTLDDMTGEDLGNLWEHVYAAGAADMYYTPIQMKKGRPGIKLSVLTTPEAMEKVREALFAHTTTIGMVMKRVERSCLERNIETFTTTLGTIHIKKAAGFNSEKEKPENDEVVAMAKSRGLSAMEIRKKILEEYNQ